ncbi:MAG: hypothetical protein ACK50B_09655, partial [Betaproteobacteria bacterium]
PPPPRGIGIGFLDRIVRRLHTTLLPACRRCVTARLHARRTCAAGPWRSDVAPRVIDLQQDFWTNVPIPIDG